MRSWTQTMSFRLYTQSDGKHYFCVIVWRSSSGCRLWVFFGTARVVELQISLSFPFPTAHVFREGSVSDRNFLPLWSDESSSEILEISYKPEIMHAARIIYLPACFQWSVCLQDYIYLLRIRSTCPFQDISRFQVQVLRKLEMLSTCLQSAARQTLKPMPSAVERSAEES